MVEFFTCIRPGLNDQDMNEYRFTFKFKSLIFDVILSDGDGSILSYEKYIEIPDFKTIERIKKSFGATVSNYPATIRKMHCTYGPAEYCLNRKLKNYFINGKKLSNQEWYIRKINNM